MPYACVDPLIIYGWSEGNRDTCICYEWIEEHNIEQYALDVVRGYMGEAVYGLPCPISLDTGLPVISEEDRALVQQAYKDYLLSHPEADPLGFYLAVAGDYESDHAVYNPALLDNEANKYGNDKDEEWPGSITYGTGPVKTLDELIK